MQSGVAIAPLRVIFGAFDRHNFGDLLFAATAAGPATAAPPIFAGLAARDLRACGGPQTVAIDAWLAERRAAGDSRPIELIHAGGEILSCDAATAAVMLMDDREFLDWSSRPDPPPPERRHRWPRLAPYLLSADALPPGSRMCCNAAGGVDLERCPPAMRAEVAAALRSAVSASVRDRRTQQGLRRLGLDLPLQPDPVEAYAAQQLPYWRNPPQAGELAALRALCPDGWIAFQCSADCGDDATLQAFAARVQAVRGNKPWPVVMFCAGTAPWHDRIEVYQRLRVWLPDVPCHVFPASHVDAIAGLLAGAAAVLATSLHALMVARKAGVPIHPLTPPAASGAAKVRAYAETWWPDVAAR